MLQPPVDTMDGRWTEMERSSVSHTLRRAIVGGPETVREGLRRFVDETAADELMVTAQIFDHGARLRSYEILADVITEPIRS
jgi:alkanesulfonate monooxygenase SsuD/methylene tetrahydromethanopterin reductase-like flavin-dependent oxidoreductase (luciferase family)